MTKADLTCASPKPIPLGDLTWTRALHHRKERPDREIWPPSRSVTSSCVGGCTSVCCATVFHTSYMAYVEQHLRDSRTCDGRHVHEPRSSAEDPHPVIQKAPPTDLEILAPRGSHGGPMRTNLRVQKSLLVSKHGGGVFCALLARD